MPYTCNPSSCCISFVYQSVNGKRHDGVIWLSQAGSIHETQGVRGHKLYNVNWPEHEGANSSQQELPVSRCSFDAPLGGVAFLPSSQLQVLVQYGFLFFFFIFSFFLSPWGRYVCLVGKQERRGPSMKKLILYWM